jgi:hypothetical protein
MSSPQSHAWTGAAVTGGQGELLGHVSAVYVDNANGRPAWAAVQGRRHTAVVPLELSRFDGMTLQVPFAAEQLETAPHHNPSTPITYEEGDDLARHFGLLPASPPPSDGLPTSTGSAGVEDGAMTRSEEQQRAGVVNVVVGRARLVTFVVTENQTFTVPVRRQEVRLVYDPVPAHVQSMMSVQPGEETHEVILHAEQVLFTSQVVPVQRVRMVKRVITTGQTVTEPIRSEQIDLEQIAEQQTDTARPSRTQQQPEGDTSCD